MKHLVIGAVAIMLAGCQHEQYRYPCQNSENWKKEICQKPLCEVSRTCPEHIFQESSMDKLSPIIQNVQSQNASKGVCK